MSGDVSVCQVCLRTDRKLDFVEVQLAMFYSELVAELVRFPIEYRSNLFCSDCTHLLRRFYNFRNKCRKAQKIMLDWKKLKVHKPPLETLYNRLPNAIGVWTARGNTIFEYSENTAINCPILTNNANNTLALRGNQNILRFIVPVITPLSQSINVPTINDNTEIKDPIKLEKDDNHFTDFKIQNVKTQNVPNTNNKEIESVEANTITFIERNALQVKLEHDYVDLTENDEQDGTNTVAKDAVCKEEDFFEEFLNVDCLKAENLNSKDLDEIDNVLSDSDFEQENTKRPDVIIVEENIEAIYLMDETDDFSDFIGAVSDDNSDDDSTEVNDVVSASDGKRLYNVTTKLTQFLNNLLDVCDVYQKLLPVKKMFDTKDYSSPKTLTQKNMNFLMNNFDAVIRNNENTMNMLIGDKIVLKEFAKNIVMKIINEEDTTSPGGSGIDKEFISQCLVEKEPMTNVKAILRTLNNKSLSDAAKKRLIIKRTKKLETSYKNSQWDDLSAIFDIKYLNTDRKAREEFERRKTYKSYIKAKFKCEICYLPFRNSRLLHNHMLNHDKEAGEFSCELCKTYYDSKRRLNNHKSLHHHRVFKCKRCPVITGDKSSAIDHCNYHKGVKIDCDICHKQFNWKAMYYTHLTFVHGCNHICPYCACAFPTEKKLEEHKVTHQKMMVRNPIGADNPGVKCDDCGLVFISKNVCEKHIRRTHMKKNSGWVVSWSQKQNKENPNKKNSDNEEPQQPLMCEQCGMLLCTKKGLKLHVLSHKNVITRTTKEVQCRVCDFTCLRRYDLSLHFKEEHPDLDIEVVYADLKPFMCDNCGKRFRHLWMLRNHILTHSGVKPFACTECPKRYYTQTKLLQHAIYHLPKSKKCDVCGKMFTTDANLYWHKKIHIQNRKFKCKHCGKGFIHRTSVKEHIRGVHHGIRRIKKTDTGNKNKNEPGKDGLDIDDVAIAAEYEITETENESTAEGYVDAEAGDEIIATRDEVTVTNIVLRKRRAKDESLKVFATTSKRVRQESSSESENSEWKTE